MYVNIWKGLKSLDVGAMVKEYAQAPGVETNYATQTIIEDVVSEDRSSFGEIYYSYRRRVSLGFSCHFPVRIQLW